MPDLFIYKDAVELFDEFEIINIDMRVPLRKMISIPYGDTYVFEFQVLKNGNVYDLTGKRLTFGIISRYSDYPPVVLDLESEGWIISPQEGRFKVVLNTLRFKMLSGLYEIEVELRESDNEFLTLLHYEVEVLKDVLH